MDIDSILSGDVRAGARLMRAIDEGEPRAKAALKELYPHTGRAHIIGITGAPGVGKSTLTDRLIQALREQHLTVGVVAVDPTSPFSGGAILGDRIRMQRHATDEGVFIRSLATRGHFGGLTGSARAVINVLDAMGKDVVLVETVGVGQDEVEIASAAHTTLVVTVPGLGDDIQAIKAGILEVGDLFVVNKADREGADRTRQDLLAMIELRHASRPDVTWLPRVYLTEASKSVGVPELLAGIWEHRDHLRLQAADHLREASRRRVQAELLDLIQQGLKDAVLSHLLANGRLSSLISDILAKRTDPYTVSDDIVARLLAECRWDT